MPSFYYKNQTLFAENVSLEKIATEYSTPCYVYSKQALIENFQALNQPLLASQKPFKIFYAVKANSNLAILNILAKLGAGFDAVSGGEIERVLAAGGNPQSIVFSGVGKTEGEITRAIELGIYCINIESEAELERIINIAERITKPANIAFRVNPDVAADSHPYISTGSKQNKFGVDYNDAIRLYTLATKCKLLNIKGISCHIGSQITKLEPFIATAKQLINLINELKQFKIHLEYVDIGGGLGVTYSNETPPTPAEYVNAIINAFADTNLELHFEPGRLIVANAGILLTKVEYLKHSGNYNFAIVDAAMNDLIRPALYESFHNILPVKESPANAIEKSYNVVGPVCESGDFLGQDRMLHIKAGDLLSIMSAGAYGFSMSSNYNTRPRCLELLIDQDHIYTIRKRETVAELYANEKIIDGI